MPEQTLKNEEISLRVMSLLKAQSDMRQRELADRVGISLGAVNYCLKALMVQGLVRLENFHNSQHKLKYAYQLTPQGIAENVALASRSLKRKMEEYDTLKSQIERLKAEVFTQTTAETIGRIPSKSGHCIRA
jgi:EPS-associated MarR family transcriptional regulator